MIKYFIYETGTERLVATIKAVAGTSADDVCSLASQRLNVPLNSIFASTVQRTKNTGASLPDVSNPPS